MKFQILFLAMALLVMPMNLKSQIASTNGGITILRCSDQKKINVGKSFKILNEDTKIQMIGPDGDYFIARYARNPKFSEFGKYYYYDSKTGEELKFEKRERLRNFIGLEGGLLSQSQSDVKFIDPTTWDSRWEKDEFYEKPFYVQNGILLTLGKTPNNDVDYIFGYNLKYGRKSWMCQIPHEGGISNIYPIDNNNVIVVADELVKLNLLNGDRKSLKIKNFFLDGKKMTASLLAGVALMAAPMVTGYVIIPIPIHGFYSSGMLYKVRGDKTTVSDLSSNLLKENNLYYLADRKEVRCFDADLNVKWHTALPPKQATTSELFMKGDTLWMINCGWGTNGTERKNLGNPFVAAFNANTGEQLFFASMGEKNASVKQVGRHDNQVTFLFNDSLKIFNLGPKGNVTISHSQKYKELRLLPGVGYMLDINSEESGNYCFSRLDVAHNIYLIDESRNVYQYTQEKGLEQSFTNRYFYRLLGMMSDSLYVLARGVGATGCWILDKQGQPMCHVEQGFKELSIRKNHLFLAKDSHLFVLSKDDLLEGCGPKTVELEQSTDSIFSTDSIAISQRVSEHPVDSLSSLN